MSSEVLVRKEGSVGRISLNRPQALHALTTGMCRTMIEALTAWRDDPAVQLVMLDHAEGRGFCAGGDIRFLMESAAAGGEAADAFFHVEYQLNHLIFSYAKPVLAIMDGIVMGGGAGLALPATYRLATERTRFAMPELGIGLFPDVGASWRLVRMPDHAGLWLILTGERIGPADCELLGVATDFIESGRLEDFKARVIADPANVEGLLAELEGDPGRPAFAAHQDQIARHYAAPTLEALLDGLAAAGTEWAQAQRETILAKSPLSTKVAFRQHQETARLEDFAAMMAMEYRIATRIVRSPDFTEGVRATIVDKDGAPRWSPPTFEAVTPAMVDAIFAPLPADREWRPLA